VFCNVADCPETYLWYDYPRLLQLDPYSLAYVSFTPSASNPHPEFADEVYFPPQTEEEVEQDLLMGPGSVDGKVVLSSYVLE
jgi:hypothetical protein